MSAANQEEQELIRKDRETHPECFYSKAISQSCKSINGEQTCEILRKVFRQCPGEKKELISKSSEVTEESNRSQDFFNQEHDTFGFPNTPFFNDNEKGFGDPFDILRDLQSMFKPFASFSNEIQENPFREQFEDEIKRIQRDHQEDQSQNDFGFIPHRQYIPPKVPTDKKQSSNIGTEAKRQQDLFKSYSGPVDSI